MKALHFKSWDTHRGRVEDSVHHVRPYLAELTIPWMALVEEYEKLTGTRRLRGVHCNFSIGHGHMLRVVGTEGILVTGSFWSLT